MESDVSRRARMIGVTLTQIETNKSKFLKLRNTHLENHHTIEVVGLTTKVKNSCGLSRKPCPFSTMNGSILWLTHPELMMIDFIIKRHTRKHSRKKNSSIVSDYGLDDRAIGR
jgi:hypothetical protein